MCCYYKNIKNPLQNKIKQNTKQKQQKKFPPKKSHANPKNTPSEKNKVRMSHYNPVFNAYVPFSFSEETYIGKYTTAQKSFGKLLSQKDFLVKSSVWGQA